VTLCCAQRIVSIYEDETLSGIPVAMWCVSLKQNSKVYK
jgi:hypothetical protein